VLGRTIPLDNQGRSRRCFLRRLLGLALSLPGAAFLGGCGFSPLAEPGPAKVPRIGYLDVGSKDASADELAAFLDQLRGLGYGVPDLIERYADGDEHQLPTLAADLLGQAPEVIVAFGTAAIRAAKDETATIPIVMAASSDPAGPDVQLVNSLARPGANVTGLTSIAPQLVGKRLQLLKQAFPEVKQVAYLLDPNNPGDKEEERRIVAVHQQLSVEALHRIEVTPSVQLQPNLAQAVANGAQALVTFASGAINRNPAPILQFAAQHRLPAMYAQADFVALPGGVMAYGPDYLDMYRRAAVFVDKILKGRPPAELPVEKPRRFVLRVNRKAVQEQGFILPRSFLAQIDEVVES
jgi:putative ABC transport system substrate-binding protein